MLISIDRLGFAVVFMTYPVGHARQERKGDQEHDTHHHAVPGRAIRGMALVDLQVMGLNVDEEVQLVGRVHDVVGAHVDAGPVQEIYHATDEGQLDGCEGQQDEVGDGEDRGGCRQERHFCLGSESRV